MLYHHYYYNINVVGLWWCACGVLVEILRRYPALAVCDTCVYTVWFSFCFLYNGNFINLIDVSLALRPAIGVAVRGCAWLCVAVILKD